MYMYSTRHFTCRIRFSIFLHEFLLKIEFQWQFWSLLFLKIPKHPQNVEIDEDLTEILKVEDKSSHEKIFKLKLEV